MAMLWHYSQNGQQVATPIPLESLRVLATSGALLPTDLVWREGLAGWVQARQVRGLFPPTNPAPAPAPAPGPGPAQGGTAYAPGQPSAHGRHPVGPSPAPRPRRPRDDEDDARPRRRRRSSPGAGGTVARALGGVAGAVLVIGLVIFGIVFGINNKSDTKRATELNDKIVNGQFRLAKLGKELGAINQQQAANFGQPLNIQAFKSKYQEMREAINALKSEAEKLDVPSKPSARKFLEEYKQFLRVEEKVLDEIGKMFPLIENPTQDAPMKLQQLGGSIMAMDAEEKRAGLAVQEAQRSFASDYNIKLLAPMTP